MSVTPRDVAAAAAAIQGHVVRTPLLYSQRLSELCRAEVLLKLESLQYTGSFKDRGACHKLQALKAAGGVKGVVAASAGNHAQGVAWHASRFGIPATIVMPLYTAFAKVERTAQLGGNVVLHGESVAEAAEHAARLAEDQGLAVVHPYEDPLIVAGQGTAAMEMLADRPDLEVLVVPIGGGGLIAGMAVWAKSERPSLRIVGVQTELCPSMYALLRGEQPPLRTATLADGIAVKRPGRIASELIRTLVDEILLVDETHLERAVQLLVNAQKVVAEGAGAAALAAMLQHPDTFAGRRTGVVVSGGNIDSRLLGNVLLRGLKREGRVVRLRVEITDQPGVLSRVAALVGDTGANILEIEHQRLFSALPARQAELDVVLETHGRLHVERILASLREQGFPAREF
jgi:threonine dehydratase